MGASYSDLAYGAATDMPPHLLPCDKAADPVVGHFRQRAACPRNHFSRHPLFRLDTEFLNDLACGRKLGFEKPLCACGRASSWALRLRIFSCCDGSDGSAGSAKSVDAECLD
jgi:hypothetical protein